ncbi:MAG: hypothetical protein EP329_15540 [Deltaproteobacteria bacterium]|nr:MAG: hypothetical protein EP329_15540 [Deltaproteobacteria bacterium]
MRKVAIICAPLLALTATSASWAAPAADPDAEEPAQLRRDLGPVPQKNAVWIEHHGSFRFRPELLLGGDLGAGESGVPSPLAATTGDDSDASTLSWASVRLRYQPTIHIGRSLEVDLGVDALDNLVLGSTYESAGLLSLDLENDAAESPSAGDNGWRDAVRVRYLYGTWHAFDVFDFSFGRMPQAFGLGVQRNGGQCPDCDFGTIVDAMRLGFTFSSFRIEGSWEWTAVGATTATFGELGQPKDLGQEDDVSTYTIQVGQRPVTTAELEQRRVDLDENRYWAFDWNLFTSFTDQALSSSEQLPSSSLECQALYTSASGQELQDVDCIQLYRRDAFFWRSGLWLKAELHPSFGTSLRLEAELAAMVGNVDHPQRLEQVDSSEPKDFRAFGGAFELEYKNPALATGIDLGFATGDNADYVGVLDGQNIVEPDDDNYAQNDNVRNNHVVTSYMFNRDYRLDLILFRQVLGAVTNAVYFKPWIATDVLQMEGATLTARFDALYALAANPEGTPGNGKQWGVELDGRLTLKLESGLSAELGVGVLIPLDALDNRTTGESADPAFAARGLVTWSF